MKDTPAFAGGHLVLLQTSSSMHGRMDDLEKDTQAVMQGLPHMCQPILSCATVTSGLPGSACCPSKNLLCQKTMSNTPSLCDCLILAWSSPMCLLWHGVMIDEAEAFQSMPYSQKAPQCSAQGSVRGSTVPRVSRCLLGRACRCFKSSPASSLPTTPARPPEELQSPHAAHNAPAHQDSDAGLSCGTLDQSNGIAADQGHASRQFSKRDMTEGGFPAHAAAGSSDSIRIKPVMPER